MGEFTRRAGAVYRQRYWDISRELDAYRGVDDYAGAVGLLREVTRDDMFAFGYYCLGMEYLNHPWVLERVYEVQDAKDYTLYLWARGHYKSTIISFLWPLWLLVQNPENRICIFSDTKQRAMSFTSRINSAMTHSTVLKHVWHDIFYFDPFYESPKHTSKMVRVKRVGDYLEESIEAQGVVGKMPTGKHYTHGIYDDLVVLENVATPDLMRKVDEGFRMSLNLYADNSMRVVAGTHYDANDQYVKMMKTKLYTVSKYACTKDGSRDGEGWFWSRETIDRKFFEMGEYMGNTQLLLNPVPEHAQTFKMSWLEGKFFKGMPKVRMNKYLLVDPAGEDNDYEGDWSVFVVIGVDQFNNRYLLDGRRGRFNLNQKYELTRDLATEWNVLAVGYEKYSMQSDIPYIREKMYEEMTNFPVPKALKGNVPKKKRIRTLVPLFEQGRMYLPESLMYQDADGKKHDFIREFLDDEYTKFPKPIHYDILDVLARQMEDDPIRFSPPIMKSPDMSFKSEKYHTPFESKDNRRDDWRLW